MITFITAFVYAFYAYLLVGLVFGLWFVVRGAQRIDEGMRGASPFLRMLLLPGSTLLWPVLLRKAVKRRQTGSNQHSG